MQPDQQNTTSPVLVKHSRPLFKIGIIVSIVIFAGLSAVGLVLQQKATKEARQQSQRLEKRLATLEAEVKFTEKQVAKDRYQAVFLSNGQVYFGKITKITKDTMKIEDIYYLNEGAVDNSGNATSDTIGLTKLGKELHSPDDAMMLERKNVLFWENLKSDGKVAQAIADHKSAQ